MDQLAFPLGSTRMPEFPYRPPRSVRRTNPDQEQWHPSSLSATPGFQFPYLDESGQLSSKLPLEYFPLLSVRIDR